MNASIEKDDEGKGEGDADLVDRFSKDPQIISFDKMLQFFADYKLMHDSLVRLEVFRDYVKDVEANLISIRRKEKEKLRRLALASQYSTNSSTSTPKSTPQKIMDQIQIDDIDMVFGTQPDTHHFATETTPAVEKDMVNEKKKAEKSEESRRKKELAEARSLFEDSKTEIYLLRQQKNFSGFVRMLCNL